MCLLYGMRTIRLITFVTWAIGACVLFDAPAAQAQDSDGQLWMRVSARARVHKRLRLVAGTQLRLADTMSEFRQSNTFGRIDYLMSDWFRPALGYRYRYQRENGQGHNEHRLYLNLNFRERLGPLRISQRIRSQLDIEPDRTGFVLRGRLGVGVRTGTPLTPFVSAEAFLRMAGYDEGVRYRKTRLTAGTEIEFGDSSLALFYRLDFVRRRRLKRLHILGLEFEHTFDFRRRRRSRSREEEREEELAPSEIDADQAVETVPSPGPSVLPVGTETEVDSDGAAPAETSMETEQSEDPVPVVDEPASVEPPSDQTELPSESATGEGVPVSPEPGPDCDGCAPASP